MAVGEGPAVGSGAIVAPDVSAGGDGAGAVGLQGDGGGRRSATAGGQRIRPGFRPPERQAERGPSRPWRRDYTKVGVALSLRGGYARLRHQASWLHLRSR